MDFGEDLVLVTRLCWSLACGIRYTAYDLGLAPMVAERRVGLARACREVSIGLGSFIN